MNGAPLLEYAPDEDVVVEDMHYYVFLNDLTPEEFRDPAAGWVVRDLAAPFIRILEVSDPTPAAAAAAAAAAAM